jgi:hypothetical protein
VLPRALGLGRDPVAAARSVAGMRGRSASEESTDDFSFNAGIG